MIELPLDQKRFVRVAKQFQLRMLVPHLARRVAHYFLGARRTNVEIGLLAR
jgi:hypothetical protein